MPSPALARRAPAAPIDRATSAANAPLFVRAGEDEPDAVSEETVEPTSRDAIPRRSHPGRGGPRHGGCELKLRSHPGRKQRFVPAVASRCTKSSSLLRQKGSWSASACLLALVLTAGATARSPGLRTHTFAFVDSSRTTRLPDGRTVARKLATVVRWPATGGPYPLVLFSHGFALTPADYAPLLQTIAAAGYVVAAPIFPLTNARAAGGPNEADLVNQPRDVSFVITKLLALNRSNGGLHGAIEPSRIAVAGQSDGGITALAVAYDARYRDRRVDAAIIMSGARPAGFRSFPSDGPPLLAMQGTADPLNAPATTAAYFAVAHRPKFLVWLVGASHLPPYTDEEPQLSIVEHSVVAFLGHYLEGRSLTAFERGARRPGLTQLIADP